MKRYGYDKVMDLHVIRTRHRITFAHHTTAHQLREFLTQVPDDATFDDFDYGTDADGDFYIEFVHEQGVPAGGNDSE